MLEEPKVLGRTLSDFYTFQIYSAEIKFHCEAAFDEYLYF